ncbi:permease prefix domain 1-containing protein [Streptomyces sp. MS191]|uniref:permease prefix domain 1-containing protein n=1 Tax=Streptomyces sp. ms191 TaxID=1827978 RepID=UPI0021C9CB0D|nr:permease prefix domain 1-containing protein [Streptomyces sp. ms191]
MSAHDVPAADTVPGGAGADGASPGEVRPDDATMREVRPDDPIEAHVTELAAALHGPARLKARMVAELRDGLVDTARDLAPEQGTEREAARRAVREFGTVAELAPGFQRELTIAQARDTARTVMTALPFLLLCWCLTQVSVRMADQGVPGAVRWAVAPLGGTAVLAALLAAAALAATGPLSRRLSHPEQLPLVVAWTGTAAAVALALGALAFTVASAAVANWPLTAAACLAALIFHARIAASARACRRCARLPLAGA